MDSIFPTYSDIFEIYRRYCDIASHRMPAAVGDCCMPDEESQKLRVTRAALSQLLEMVDSKLNTRVTILEESHELMLRIGLMRNWSEEIRIRIRGSVEIPKVSWDYGGLEPQPSEDFLTALNNQPGSKRKSRDNLQMEIDFSEGHASSSMYTTNPKRRHIFFDKSVMLGRNQLLKARNAFNEMDKNKKTKSLNAIEGSLSMPGFCLAILLDERNISFGCTKARVEDGLTKEWLRSKDSYTKGIHISRKLG